MSEKRQSTEANIDMNQMLKLSDCFNKQLGILLKQMKKKNKNRKSQQRNRSYKKEPNGSYRTEK